jgi:hypothetical protein
MVIKKVNDGESVNKYFMGAVVEGVPRATNTHETLPGVVAGIVLGRA